MPFPIPVASVLTGASISQLAHWRRTDLLVPETKADGRPLLYSFRDLLALRTVVRLRHDVSLQKIRRAFGNLPRLDYTEHPSRYDLVQVGDTIAIRDSESEVIDLVRAPGQQIANLGEVLKAFRTEDGADVVDFLSPRPNLTVREQRLGGWPTIAGTRIPYDVIASLMADGSVAPRDIRKLYPSVSAAAARDALRFAESLPGDHVEAYTGASAAG